MCVCVERGEVAPSRWPCVLALLCMLVCLLVFAQQGRRQLAQRCLPCTHLNPPPALPPPLATRPPQIGRTAPADIVVPIPTVSTRHAVVRVVDASGAAAGSVQVRSLLRMGCARPRGGGMRGAWLCGLHWCCSRGQGCRHAAGDPAGRTGYGCDTAGRQRQAVQPASLLAPASHHMQVTDLGSTNGTVVDGTELKALEAVRAGGGGQQGGQALEAPHSAALHGAFHAPAAQAARCPSRAALLLSTTCLTLPCKRLIEHHRTPACGVRTLACDLLPPSPPSARRCRSRWAARWCLAIPTWPPSGWSWWRTPHPPPPPPPRPRAPRVSPGAAAGGVSSRAQHPGARPAAAFGCSPALRLGYVLRAAALSQLRRTPPSRPPTFFSHPNPP